ncbi:unnamed protein product [Rotaria sordida]|nr:unnamed protein product [Rotaria sordida]
MLTFLHINYLQIKCVNYMETELLVKFILTLMKSESYHLIRLLCFSIPTADDKMVRKLETIIIVKNLLWNCTIKLIGDNIYVLKSSHSSLNMSITLIENLSNEFFFEIFEYLDGYEIYQTFSNLNHRFQQLINSSSLLLKFNYHYLTTSDKIHMNNFKQFLLNHKHQIVLFYMGISMESQPCLQK